MGLGCARGPLVVPLSMITAVTTQSGLPLASLMTGDAKAFLSLQCSQQGSETYSFSYTAVPKAGLQHSTPCQTATQRPGYGVIQPHPTKGYAGGLLRGTLGKWASDLRGQDARLQGSHYTSQSLVLKE